MRECVVPTDTLEYLEYVLYLILGKYICGQRKWPDLSKVTDPKPVKADRRN